MDFWCVHEEECDLCYGLGVLPFVGVCTGCNGTGHVEVEGPGR